MISACGAGHDPHTLGHVLRDRLNIRGLVRTQEQALLVVIEKAREVFAGLKEGSDAVAVPLGQVRGPIVIEGKGALLVR